MDFVNKTKVCAGWTLGFERDGRELVVVAVKATFSIPKSGVEPELAEEQAPLIEADLFTGEPGYTAPLYESDYAHRKPKCDVLLNGSAYAPKGKPVDRIQVGMRVGPLSKTFDVVGDRVWRDGILGPTASSPKPFTVMPISYDRAFGGIDRSREDPASFRWFLQNHAGAGYHEYLDAKSLYGKPLPNTEEPGHPVKNPRGPYRPMAFGPVGRSWQPRASHAGTYDATWLNERAPFWPDDFDYRYFQAAPDDQQIPYPTGGDEVVLTHLTPQGFTRFSLPKMSMPVVMIPVRGYEYELPTAIDTIVIEPDKDRFTLTWRGTQPMKRDCFEILQTIVGEELRSVRRRRRTRGKKYYRSLDEMIRDKRATRGK